MRWPWDRRRSRLRATLYSKNGCGLCDEAHLHIVRVFGAENVDVVDIIGNRELEDAYIFRIPVLVVSDVIRAEGRITMADVKSAYRAGLSQIRIAESR